MTSPTRTAWTGLRCALFEPEAAQVLAEGTLRTEVAGTARGVLVGGTLALLAQCVGTPEHRPATGGLAVLEDVGRAGVPDRLDAHPAAADRLVRRGGRHRAGHVGAAAGRTPWTSSSSGCAPLGVPDRVGLGRSVMAVPQLTVPLGVEAELDADAGSLVLDRPALR